MPNAIVGFQQAVGLVVLCWRIKAILPTETCNMIHYECCFANDTHTSSTTEDESQGVLKKTQESGLHLSPDSAII